MVRSSKIFFSTKKVVRSSSKPRITTSRSSFDRSWQSRACHLEKSLTTLVLTWTLTLTEGTQIASLVSVIFFVLFFLYHALGPLYLVSTDSTLPTIYSAYLRLGTLIRSLMTCQFFFANRINSNHFDCSSATSHHHYDSSSSSSDARPVKAYPFFLSYHLFQDRPFSKLYSGNGSSSELKRR
jgi:hypothetical protein